MKQDNNVFIEFQKGAAKLSEIFRNQFYPIIEQMNACVNNENNKELWKIALDVEEKETITISQLVEVTHENARNKGFWDDWDSICWEDGLDKNEASTLEINELFNNAIATRLMLIVSEVSEALEALRNNDQNNFKEELADVIIRTCDLAGGLNIDLEDEVLKKINKNKDRPYKHGKKF